MDEPKPKERNDSLKECTYRSKKDIKKICTCPLKDNEYVFGTPFLWVNRNCPVHGEDNK